MVDKEVNKSALEMIKKKNLTPGAHEVIKTKQWCFDIKVIIKVEQLRIAITIAASSAV